jgi:hypothetical protein
MVTESRLLPALSQNKTGQLEEAYYLTNNYGTAVTTIINLKDLKFANLKISRLTQN